MKLPLYFISDNHFMMTFDDKEITRRGLLFSLFEEIRKTGGTLIIGGDFFDFWFDYKHVFPKYYFDIVYELSRLNKSGIEIHYLAGNHDFWDFGFLTEQAGCIFHAGDFEFLLDDQKILITHGDGLLHDDNGYRLMKKIIRHPICISLFRGLHANLGCGLAKYISNTSNRYNQLNDKTQLIRDEITQFARQEWMGKYHTILIGHYHQVGFHHEEKFQLIWLGDWIQHFTVTKYDLSGWSQCSWNDKNNN